MPGLRPARRAPRRLRAILLSAPPARSALAPAAVVLLFLAALAARAGAADGFRFLAPVEAGDAYARPGVMVPGERVLHGNGYDGQFSFALAQDPFLRRPDTAASLDNTFRVRRLLYPLLAWTLALGQRGAVAYTLVAINVVAGAALAWLLALAAVRAGRSPWWAVAAAAYPGVWIPVLIDTTEPLQLALLAAGMLADSALLLFLATLAKETAGVALATQAVRAALARDWRRAAAPGGLAALFIAWALFVFVAVRGTVFNTLGAHFLDPPGAPFLALGRGAAALVMVPALAATLLALARPLRFRDAAAWAGAAYALLVLMAGFDTWTDPAAYFRVSAGAIVLAYLSWVRTGDRLGLAMLAAGLAGTAVSLVPLVLA